MHGIAATKFGANRADIFLTDTSFQVVQSMWNGTSWQGFYDLNGYDLSGHGQFATVPAAVAWMARPPLVSEGDTSTTGGGGGTGGGHGGHGVITGVVTSGGAATTGDAGAGGGSPTGVIERGGPGGDVAGLLDHQRIDVFGVGSDFAMYTKTLWNQPIENRAEWFNLGGIFTSAPAAVVWNAGHGNRVDVFGLGTDHALFQKTFSGAAWTADWARLGGTFSSAASVVSWGKGQIDIFVRGTDYTLRHRAYNGTTFLNDWQNLGGNLASEPVAVSWGPNRLDVFAVFHDGLLWHTWWDGMIWNEWESLGGTSTTPAGAFNSAPTAATWARERLDVFATGADDVVYHFWWANGAWSGPEAFGGALITSAPTVISTQANWLDVFAPGRDKNLYHRQFNGSAWQPATWQPVIWDRLNEQIGLPSRYRFSVDFVTVDTARSLNTDTDTASASLAAGNWPTQTTLQGMGDVGGTDPKQAETNLLDFEPVALELCEAGIFSYLIVNNGHADQKGIDGVVSHAAETLTDDGAKAVAQQLGLGIPSLTALDIAGSVVPVIGTLLIGTLVQYLMQQLEGIVFANCDGIVAAELIGVMGRDLSRKTAHGPYKVTTTHPGTDSPTGCGANSVYEVTWSIRRV